MQSNRIDISRKENQLILPSIIGYLYGACVY